MRRLIKIITGVLIAFGAVAGTSVASTNTAAAGDSLFGCPEGAVCIYSEDGWWDDEPEHYYYSYGVHRLYNEYGDHVVFNNQYGGATVSVNEGSDGSGAVDTVAEGDWIYINLTPINSITLSR